MGLKVGDGTYSSLEADETSLAFNFVYVYISVYKVTFDLFLNTYDCTLYCIRIHSCITFVVLWLL